MLHTVFIALHAGAATVALVAGAVALRSGRLFAVYGWSLLVMFVTVALAVGVNWEQTGPAVRAVFVALVALGAAMLAKAWRAGRNRPVSGGHPSSCYVRDVGFTLIALCDAFVVVAVLNAGAPTWLVVASGVSIAVVGHFVLDVVERRLVSPGVVSSMTA